MTVVFASLNLSCRRAQVFARVAGGRIWAFGSSTGRASKAVTGDPVHSVPPARPPAPRAVLLFLLGCVCSPFWRESQTSTSKKEASMKPCTVNDNAQDDQSAKQDIYARITAKIVAALEDGVRPWVRPWNAEHAAGRITRPLRHNGQPYTGINILSLWASASVQGFAAPIWMTYRQALELDAHVRKGEKGSLVVYANSITRTEHDDKSGEDVEREIPYMKGYTVFNVEQIEGLPEIYYAKVVPTRDPVARIDHVENFFGSLGATIKH